MNIFYIGEEKSSSTSSHRAFALKRLGHNVEIFNPRSDNRGYLGNSLVSKFHYHTGYIFLQGRMCSWLKKILNNGTSPDLIWIDSGELIGKECLRILRSVNVPVILYNVDDPTGARDGNRFFSLKKALPLYDLVVVVRKETQNECFNYGVHNVLLKLRSYDEVAHSAYVDLNEIPPQFSSEVAFIGTWMRHERRDEFLLHLIDAGIPISIWGNRWHKSPYWNRLKPYFRGNALGGRDYVSAMQGAKICLGLLSKGNRDLHTQRSLEVPYAGGVLCAERTTEHLDMYRDGVEAVFWSDATECICVCKKLLSDDHLREKIRLAGMQRVRSLQVGNEDVCQQILKEVVRINIVAKSEKVKRVIS
ncbi:CgeB family protein [Spirosoma spitsbergense]|uniref:CgeB family protein n=1 Tax=Spirosoma spitsbergense TaxID=431554 RepID=UPI00037E6B99|nr:glycosyltransferase [Spirosoma spitsbergense]